jgi:hypothetical protein
MWTRQPKQAAVAIDFGRLTHHNLGQLKLLDMAIFPVRYQEGFYRGLLKECDKDENLVRLGTSCSGSSSAPLSSAAPARFLFAL